MTDEQIIDGILEREGGYVNDPADAGGPTKYGITLSTLAQWRKQDVTAADVQALSEDEAREIYRASYIRGPGFDKITDSRLRALLVDSAVQHGPVRAVKWLQDALAVEADGVFGADTLAALRLGDMAKVYRAVYQRRLGFYASILSARPDQRRFAAGWINRMAEFA